MNLVMKLYTLLICLTLFHLDSCKIQRSSNQFDDIDIHHDPDSRRNVTELISSKGYPVENYTLQTEDGYLLSIQRIPYGRNNKYGKTIKRPPVLLQHGLLTSAVDWVVNFPTQSLGYILADAGYDVWLGNIRGNTYSRRHVKLSPDMKEFWDFSFDQMGEYDLPAMIDYVLNITKQDDLFYVGHSQGTTCMFALLSEQPEYNKKIKLFVALAPVTTVGHMTSAIRYFAPFTKDVDFLFELLGVHEFLPNTRMMRILDELFCDTEIKFLCENLIFLLCGTDHSQLNETRMDVYVAQFPAGASTQCIIHYAQMINSKKFQKYDYGEAGNLKHYNQITPPEYNVENITAPVVLMWSKNDKMADPKDVRLLQFKLKNLADSICIKLDSFNHVDFTWGVQANILVYKDILRLFKQYSHAN